MITKRCLCARIGGADRKFHLQTTINPAIPHNIYVRIDNANRYCPLASGTASNCINVRIGNADYHTVDYTPKVRLTWQGGYDPQPYKNPNYIYNLKITMLNSVTINNPIQIYMQMGDQSQYWRNVLTLPKGSVSATYAGGRDNGRFSTDSKGYIKVGNWTSSQFSIYNRTSIDITIPESYWGV
ncbi:MAG: hypothetical protein IKB72_04505 [Ruminococcus sp.]|nr:hypothetical protein [Ruminococcus sp.]